MGTMLGAGLHNAKGHALCNLTRVKIVDPITRARKGALLRTHLVNGF
jgi:hypothetical protein